MSQPRKMTGHDIRRAATPLEYAGPAIFSYGFRPFFLGGAAWAALAVALWLLQYFGEMSLPTAFNPLDWHIHEMIYGYVAATITGFLLTAIPNWTGRLPVNGYPLACLFALWFTGRVAIAGSAVWGPWIAAMIDVAFLVIFAAIALREVVAGNNWRNLRILVMLGVLIAGNIVFHAEEILHGHADYGVRIAIAALIVLITLVGGRIVPSFTNNWLARNNPGRLPVCVFSIRRGDACRQRAGAGFLDRVTAVRRNRRCVVDCGRASGHPSCSVGPATVPSAIVSFWSSTLLMCSSRLASCCWAPRLCGLHTRRRVQAFTPGPPVLSV